MVYKFFDSKVSGSGAPQNEQLANELHKPIIRKFEKRRVYSTFKDNIWGVDLADMQLLSKYNKGIRFLLCVIDIFSKYAWVVPLKDKKVISIVKAFQIILKQSNRKQNKIWVDKGCEFYNAYFKKWLREIMLEIMTYIFNDLNGEEIIVTFYEKELQKATQEEFRIEKVISRKGDKLYVKWKGYDNSCNSWIDKANLVQRM